MSLKGQGMEGSLIIPKTDRWTDRRTDRGHGDSYLYVLKVQGMEGRLIIPKEDRQTDRVTEVMAIATCMSPKGQGMEGRLMTSAAAVPRTSISTVQLHCRHKIKFAEYRPHQVVRSVCACICRGFTCTALKGKTTSYGQQTPKVYVIAGPFRRQYDRFVTGICIFHDF